MDSSLEDYECTQEIYKDTDMAFCMVWTRIDMIPSWKIRKTVPLSSASEVSDGTALRRYPDSINILSIICGDLTPLKW